MERNCGPMDKNRVSGVAEQGERAFDREALMTKARRRTSGGRAVKDRVLTWGDLASRLKGRRLCPEREVSRSHSRGASWRPEGPNEEGY